MIRMSAVLIVAFCITSVLGKRSAAERHLIWAIAIGSAVMLPFFSSLLPSWEAATPAAVAAVSQIVSRSGAAFGFNLVVNVDNPGSAALLSRVLFAAWILGVFVAGLLLSVGFARLVRLTWRASSMSAAPSDVRSREIAEIAKDVAARLGIKRPIRLLKSAATAMPLTWGSWRPVVLLPQGALHWSDARVRVVLAHEFAHIRRRDSLIEFLALAVRAVYWFNPLFWIACSRLRRESEQSADDAVLNLDVDGADYAEHLLAIAREIAGSNESRLPALAFARPSNLERRFAAMLDPTLNRRLVTRPIALVIAIGAMCIVAPLAVIHASATEQHIQPLPPVLAGDTIAPKAPKMTAYLAAVPKGLPAPQNVRIGNAGSIPNGAMIPPTLIESTPPLYTAEAWDRGIEGTVTLEARVDINGNVEVLRVLKGLGFGLDENAAAAVRDWKFTSARRNGVPVEAISQIDVDFSQRTRNAARMGTGISPPRIVQRVEVKYSEEARKARLQGTVVLEAIVKKDGSVDLVRVVRGLDMGLTESAVTALRQWRMDPAIRNGQPIDVALNIEVNFNLK